MSRTIFVLLVLLAAGCTRGTAPEDREAARESHDPSRAAVRLSPDELALHGVAFEAAGPGTVDRGIELAGEIRPNGERLAHIVPRFAGIAREVRVSVGATVRTGDVLAVVESSNSLARFELRTLIDGVVIARHLTLGEAVGPDTQAFVIADLRSVWAEFAVHQKDLPLVRMGRRLRILAESPEEEAEGEISYVTPIVDEDTRSAAARAVLPNPGARWRPGTFVTGRVLDPVEVPLAVTRDAVQTIEGRPSVFVLAPDAVVPRAVVLGRSGETRVEVASGLRVGERYAARGAFLLKAELGKDSAEHDH